MKKTILIAGIVWLFCSFNVGPYHGQKVWARDPATGQCDCWVYATIDGVTRWYRTDPSACSSIPNPCGY